MAQRRKTRTVTVGDVKIGSDYPVSIQSMTKTDTRDVDATVSEIHALEAAGCEIVRSAVKDSASAKALSAIRKRITIPLVADIHFDYKLALLVIKGGIDKIRINPGNIYEPGEVNAIIDEAHEAGIPIRIGINSGSLRKSSSPSESEADEMVSSALRYLELFRKKDFNDLVISLKSASCETTVAAYRRIAAECDYPLHLGVTAAGLPEDGIVRSSIGIGTLLVDGIGDTVRVSLTGDPVEEVGVAKRILSTVGMREFGHEIISCPTCGRCQVDLVSIVKELEVELKKKSQLSDDEDKQLTIAIMGCEVNGPGEAMNADIGIAFGSGKGAIFRRGEIIKTVKVDSAIRELLDIINEES
ncbi:flavodoxin-dependent (E)-4-hydroxy-3-methylbut-2-enyl-diphosphate synthase [Candidatus Omnitrophota bacterium]